LLQAGGAQDEAAFTVMGLRLFDRHKDQLYVLLGRDGDPAFAQRFRTEFPPGFLRALKLDGDPARSETIAIFGMSAMLGLLGHWHETGRKQTGEEFLETAKTLIQHGVRGYLSDQRPGVRILPPAATIATR
jgi:hypothetical protein